MLLTAILVATSAAAAVPDLRGIAFEEALNGPAIVAPAIPEGGLTEPLPIVVHLTVDLAAFDGAGAAVAQDRLAARLALYQARRVPVVLVLGALPAADADMQVWQRRVRSIAERHHGAMAAYELGAVQRTAGFIEPPIASFGFAVKQASILIRSADPDAAVALGPIGSDGSRWLTDLYGQGVAPYIDALTVTADQDAAGVEYRDFGSIVDRHDPTAALWYGPGRPLAADAIVANVLRHLGTRVTLPVFASSPDVVQSVVAKARPLADLIGGRLVALDATGVRWSPPPAAGSRVEANLVFNVSASATYLIYASTADALSLDVEIDASMTTPAIRNPYTGAVQPLTVPSHERNRPARLTVPVSRSPIVLDFNYGQAPYAVNLETRQVSLPPVEEIIARHQQRQAAQDAALRNYIAHLRIEMHFHPSPAESAYNVIMENTLFAEGAASEWAQHSFSLNGATWTSNPPPFPLLQPEKVLSLPLDLRLNQDYRYKLDGVDTVNGREAYAVSFAPGVTTQALYRGTVWIDRATFSRLKVSAVQIGGSGVVQANEEEQIYASVGELSGRPVWLMTHLKSRQTLMVAGRTVLNEREARLTDVRMNVPDFDRARESSRRGNDVMYRDTAQGVRYLVKRGEARVVSEKLTTSARAFAMGANIDPSFDYPLPIAGLEVLDFNVLNKDLQLALLFGGVIGFGNIQKSGMLSGRLDASLDFFGIGLKGNDAVFDAAGERSGERLQTLPGSLGINAGYRFSASHKVSARFDVRYDHYSRAALTDTSFIVPSSTVTTGEGVGYEFRRRGYSLLANAGTFRRNVWTRWGAAAEFDPEHRTYARFDAGLSKDFIFKTFHTVHLNGQYFGGRRLDRFSMYQFGMFDPARMHGVPSAVRFGELAMLRGSYSFNLFEQYRLDLFLDHAIGRPRSQEPWQHVTGFGVAVSLKGPRSTIILRDVGRSILPDVYRGVRSTVVQILILKPL